MVQLGGDTTTEPDTMGIGHTAQEVLANDRDTEFSAIELYKRTVADAQDAQDESTHTRFQSTLRDAESGYRLFSDLLEEG